MQDYSMDTDKTDYSIAHRQDVREALEQIKSLVASHHFVSFQGRIEEIEREYSLMKDYMERGFSDPQRPHLYQELLKDLFVLLREIQLKEEIYKGGSYTMAMSRTLKFDTDSEAIRQHLEGFVQDVALLSLDLGDGEGKKRSDLYKEHQSYMSDLFDAILISSQWSEGTAKNFKDLLLSPTLESTDVQLLVSAISLSAIQILDINKVKMLMDVYMESQDEKVRQRALVGWAFALPQENISIFQDLSEKLKNVCEDKQVRRELLELQMQVIYCYDVDKDRAEIQNEIMPTLMKNNNLKITRFGITEKEDDPLQDILDPDASERKMEEVEKSIQKMADMQKAGSDIYFGGFSQMKRFPFFSNLSNWFVPFFLDHPALEQLRSKMQNTNFLEVLLNSGPFCDSDKYSLTLAMVSIIDKLPSNVKEMLGTQEAFFGSTPDLDTHTPTYIRRMYLQDLYRFFRLYDRKSDFKSPFFVSSDFTYVGFFFTKRIFGDLLRDEVRELSHFLMKRKDMVLLEALDGYYFSESSVEAWLLRAYIESDLEDYGTAIQSYQRALALNPNSERALKGYAQCCLHYRKFAEAEEAYRKLLQTNEGNIRLQLRLAFALISQDKMDEGFEILYKVRYEHPDNQEASRIFAWASLLQGKLEQAEKVYGEMKAHGQFEPVDNLNYGYCKLFHQQVSQGIELFREYISSKTKDKQKEYESLYDDMQEDKVLLSRYGFTDVDLKLICDLVVNPRS